MFSLKMFITELNDPVQPAAARPVSHDAGSWPVSRGVCADEPGQAWLGCVCEMGESESCPLDSRGPGLGRSIRQRGAVATLASEHLAAMSRSGVSVLSGREPSPGQRGHRQLGEA
jgi:hypothetical protein